MHPDSEKPKRSIDDLVRLKIFEAASFEAIAIFDEKIKCVDVNQQFSKLFQYSRAEAVSMSGPDFLKRG